jgi:hypothetical protein
MTIQPCWYCGAVPERQTKTLLNVEWAAYSCCTTGSYSPHEDHTVDSWNRMQQALALLRTVERLSHVGRFRVGPLKDKFSAVVFNRQRGLDCAVEGESAADALIKLQTWIDS